MYTDRMELAKILLESGADVNARNNLNSTPLHIIAQLGNWKDTVEQICFLFFRCIQWLFCWTFMKHLGRDDGEEFAQMLVENGANITARDNLNLTPYDVAKQKGNIFEIFCYNRKKRLYFYTSNDIFFNYRSQSNRCSP